MNFLNQNSAPAISGNLANYAFRGYSLMVREARGATLNPGAQISKAGAEFMLPGAQY